MTGRIPETPLPASSGPIVTVAIPVRNRARLVRGAIDSALGETTAGLECVVVDNASTDGTWDVLQSYDDPRFRSVRNEENLGLQGNLNRCLELARGRYVCLLCSDDRLLPGFLSRAVATLEAHPNVALLSSRGWFVDADLRRIRPLGYHLAPGIYAGDDAIVRAFWALAHYRGPFNYPSGMLLRRSAAREVGGFDVQLRHLVDFDYWVRLLEVGDLAIDDGFGCEVMLHEVQETTALVRDGDFTDEWCPLARRFAPRLRDAGIYDRVIEQTAATSAWMSVYSLAKRRPRAARKYWRIAAEESASPASLALGMLRFASLAALSLGGVRFPPPGRPPPA